MYGASGFKGSSSRNGRKGAKVLRHEVEIGNGASQAVEPKAGR